MLDGGGDFLMMFSDLGTPNGVVADFVNGIFSNAVQSFSRNSTATRVNPSLLYESVSANVLRISYDKKVGNSLGAFIEDAATNQVPNATFAGLVAGTIGSGGSYPTGWNTSNSISMPQIDVSAVTVNGQPGMQLHIHGTAPAGGGYILQFAPTTSIVVAPADVWMTQADLSLAAGSLNGITAVTLGFVERNSSGTFVQTDETAIYAPSQLAAYTQKLNSRAQVVSSGVRATPFLKLNVTNGAAIDLTLNLSEVGFFKQSAPTSEVYSNGAALARVADDLSIALPSYPNASYLLKGEPRLISDGCTFAHLVDGSNNGLRFYRSGFLIYGVLSAAGVDGTPVALGKCLPGAPMAVEAIVNGAVVTAGLNGKSLVPLSGNGAAYNRSYCGEKSDKSNQWGGYFGYLAVDPNVNGRSAVLAEFWDDFDRAGGAIGSAPGGKQWVQVPTSVGPQVVLATISGGKLVAADSGQATTAAYNGFDMGAGLTIKEMRAIISWTAGTAGGSATLISNPNGLSAITNITGASVHIVFTLSGVDVAVWVNGVYSIIQSITLLSNMLTDGTQYAIGWELDGTTITVYTSDGRSYAVTDSRLGTQGGRYATFEHFHTGAAQDFPNFHAAYARAA